MNLPKMTPAAVPPAKSDEPQENNQDCLRRQEAFGLHRKAGPRCQHDGHDVHEGILSRVGQTAQTACLGKEVTQHEHPNQGAYGRKQ